MINKKFLTIKSYHSFFTVAIFATRTFSVVSDIRSLFFNIQSDV